MSIERERVCSAINSGWPPQMSDIAWMMHRIDALEAELTECAAVRDSWCREFTAMRDRCDRAEAALRDIKGALTNAESTIEQWIRRRAAAGLEL